MTLTAPLPERAAEALRRWLGEEWTAEPLAGDASVRQYYRVRVPSGESYVLAWYPDEARSQLQRSLDAYRAVSRRAYVPKILQHDDSAVLQQDIGDRRLFDLLHEDRDEGLRWYRKAITLLVYFQKAGGLAVNPPFTADFFTGELEMARTYYVERLMGASPEVLAALQPLLRKLAENIAVHPYVLCHRDYHGQNIHLLNEKLYLIDYQDLRMGPDTYDLASLLRDRGVGRVIGDEAEMDLVDYYAEWRVIGFPARSPLPHGERRSMRRRYLEVLLQRSIKILGTFARQPIERGRLHYLEFIPPTIESIRRCLADLPIYADLAALLPMDFSIREARERVERKLHASTQNHASAG